MKGVRIGILIIFFIAIIGVSTASIPDTVVITSDTPWLIAGGSDTARITVKVSNLSTPLLGAHVRAWVDIPIMGTISPAPPQYVRTDITGIIEKPFILSPGTKSGVAKIFFEVSDPATGIYYSNTSWFIEQNIDHANPLDWETISYNSPLWVNNTTLITIRLIDQYGNIVDNRRIAENITFTDSEDGDGGFLQAGNFKNNSITIPVQIDGYVTVTYKVSSNPSGSNVIHIIAPDTAVPSTKWITIQGNATTPISLKSFITSNYDLDLSSPHEALANNRDLFSIKYVVEDRFGNPVPDIDIEWTTSLGRRETTTTNAFGYILLKYGPSTKIQTITINATVIDYSALKTSDSLDFISGGAQFMEVGASPQLVASRDVNPDVTSSIIAIVLDSAGRPVPDQDVSFEIINDEPVPPASRNQSATLSRVGNSTEVTKIIETTDDTGQAIVEYHPGSFPLLGQGGYNRTATGKSTIRVIWDGEIDDIIIIYKNYPYIATKAFSDRSVVEEGEFINITIQLIGDGYAFENPVDVVLLEDRADSMLLRVDKGINEDEDRMLHAENAARIFLGMMESGKDRVGIVSFGEKTTSADLTTIPQMKKLAGDDNRNNDDAPYIATNYPANGRNYTDWATIDLPLTTDFNSGKTANQTLDEIVPFKNSFGGQPSAGFRYGIYQSITHLLDSGTGQSKVKAVVGLLDTDWTWYGDPKVGNSGNPSFNPLQLGGGTNQYYPFTDPISGGYTGKWSLTNASENWQNMSNYARDNGIRLYVVTYTPDVPSSRRVTISEMCAPTGGFHIHAATPEELRQAFILVAEDIKSAAGEGAVMELDLSTINVTYQELGEMKSGVFPGGSVFNYTPIPGSSTHVDSWNCTDPEDKNTCDQITDELHMPPPFDIFPHYAYDYDHSAEWNDTKSLSFYVGNITIKQVWEANFTFKTKMAGSICVFGDNSQICFIDFENKEFCSEVPPVCISVEENLTFGPHTPGILDILDGSVVAKVSDTDPNQINVPWNLYYSGTHPVRQVGFYSYTQDNVSWSDWIQFGTNDTGSITGERVEIPYTEFGLKKFIVDTYGCYIFKIFAYEDLGGGDIGTTDEEMNKTPVCIYSNAKILIR